jgi:hypothetical protein
MMDQEFKHFENIDATPEKYIGIQTRILLRIEVHHSDL